MKEHDFTVELMPGNVAPQRPKVSVIIPSYNRYIALKRAIESVNHPSCEIIVVDDGSTPPVKAYLEEAGISNVILIRKVNGGAASARNLGLEHARGQYIAYLDSDDFFSSDKLIVITELMDANPDIDFAFHDIRTVFTADNGEITSIGDLHSKFFPQMLSTGKKSKEIAEDVYILPSIEVFSNLTSGCPIFPSSVIQRRSAVNKVGYFRGQFEPCEDTEYFARSVYLSDTLYIHKPFCQKGSASDNLSHDSFSQTQLDIYVLKSLISENDQRLDKNILQRSLSRRLRALGWAYKKRHDYKNAYKAYRNSLKERSSLNAIYNLINITIKEYWPIKKKLSS